MNIVAEKDYDLEQAIDRIVRQYEAKPMALIMILQDVQTHYRYLPRPALDLVAERMKLPISQVFAVATFYRSFSLEPKGHHHICVCTGTACHVRQAWVNIDRLERKLAIKAGQTTEDGEFSFETVNCLGACALGPLITVDEDFYGNMTVPRIDRMLKKLGLENSPGQIAENKMEGLG